MANALPVRAGSHYRGPARLPSQVTEGLNFERVVLRNSLQRYAGAMVVDFSGTETGRGKGLENFPTSPPPSIHHVCQRTVNVP
jgi:hypothetical protein